MAKTLNSCFAKTLVTISLAFWCCEMLFGIKKLPTPNFPGERDLPTIDSKKSNDKSIEIPAPSPTPSEETPPLCGTEHSASFPILIN